MLERRNSSAKKKRSSRAAKDSSGPISSAEFIDMLTRYYHKLQKDEDDFCVVSLSILDYKKAAAVLGDEVAAQIDRAATRVMFGGLRADDRVCLIAPAQCIVLMPATTYGEALSAMRRIVSAIGEKAIRSKAAELYPSAVFKVASSAADYDDTTSSAKNGLPDHLLASVGYTIDPKGQLVSIEEAGETAESIFGESFDDWRLRYRILKGDMCEYEVEPFSIVTRRMHDLWSADSEVQLRVLRMKGVTLSESTAYALLRRLRALQSLDHPGLSKLLDYYIDGDGTIYLVNVPGDRLLRQDTVADLCSSDAALPSYLDQILKACDSSQSVIPPVVLNSFQNIKVMCSENGSIVLENYDLESLACAIQEETNAAVSPASLLKELSIFFMNLTAHCKQKDKEFTDFLKAMKEKSNDEWNSFTRVRSKLKSLMERETTTQRT